MSLRERQEKQDAEHHAQADAAFQGLLSSAEQRRTAAVTGMARASDTPQEAEATSALADLLLEHLESLWADLLRAGVTVSGKCGAADWDESLAVYVASLGPGGRSTATHLRSGAQSRSGQPWRLWLPGEQGVPGFAVVLAYVVFREQAAVAGATDAPATALSSGSMPDGTAGSSSRDQPALSLAVMERVAHAHRAGNRPMLRGDSPVLIDADGAAVAEIGTTVATIDAEALLSLTRTGVGLLGSVHAHRLLRWEVQTGHEQVIAGQPDPRLLTVAGGWAGLADSIGSGCGGKARQQVQAVLVAQAHLRFRFPDGGTGNLLSYDDQPARGQRAARLVISLGPRLLPHYVLSLEGRSRSVRDARRLVPVLPLPPLVGRSNEGGAQAALQLLVMLELRRRVRELASEGGVLIDSGRFAELAEQVRLPAKMLPRVLTVWATGDDHTPAFLTQTETDRYTLGSEHAAALEMLLAAAEIERGAARGGRLASRRRRERIASGFSGHGRRRK